MFAVTIKNLYLISLRQSYNENQSGIMSLCHISKKKFANACRVHNFDITKGLI